MSRTTTYQIRIDEKEKQETFAVLHDLGITPAQAVKNVLYAGAYYPIYPISYRDNLN